MALTMARRPIGFSGGVTQSHRDNGDNRYRDLRHPRRVKFFCNGDKFFQGKQVHITPHRYITFNDLLNDLTQKLHSHGHLPYGVRNIYTPVGGRKISNIEEFQDGQHYVCGGFEKFNFLKYGAKGREPWAPIGKPQHRDFFGEVYSSRQTNYAPPPTYRFSNNAFYPQRVMRGSYPRRTVPGPIGKTYYGPGEVSHVGGAAMKPKVITVIRNNERPRASIKILLNRRSVQSYEQLVKDISEAFGPKWKANKVKRLFNMKGREVMGVSDFFREDDIFLGLGAGEFLTYTDVEDMLEEMYPDNPYAHNLVKEWDKNKKRQRVVILKKDPRDDGKKDSGLGSDSSNKDDEETSRIERERQQEKARKRMAKQQEAERKEAERREVERREVERREAERKEAERKEAERRESERKEAERREAERKEAERLEAERREVDRLEAERQEAEHREAERREAERKAQEEEEQRVKALQTISDNNETQKAMIPVRDSSKASSNIHKEPTPRDIERLIREESKKREKTKSFELSRRKTPEVNKSDRQKTHSSLKGDDVTNGNTEVTPIVKPSTPPPKESSWITVQSDFDKETPRETAREPVEEPITEVEPLKQPVPSKAPEKSSQSVKSVKQERPKTPSSKGRALDIKERTPKPNDKKKKDKSSIRKTKLERQISRIEHVHTKYEPGKTLGDGNFAVVKQCKLKNTKTEYAMKIIDKAKLKGKENMIENEIEIMKLCNHPNIVKLIEEFETKKEIYLIMELIKGGDLFDAITQSVKFGEKDAASMTTDLCNALFYLHSRHIVHRDLKPENLLVCRNKDNSISLKLADFGLAMEVTENIYTVCGTPTYVAPEILAEIGYGLEVDMWACGVIAYILLCGFPPFRSPDRNQTELFEFIKAGEYEFLSPYWDSISKSAKDLIQHLLVVDRRKRYTAVDTLCHPWVLTLAGGKRLSGVPEEARRQRRDELEMESRSNREAFLKLKEEVSQ